MTNVIRVKPTRFRDFKQLARELGVRIVSTRDVGTGAFHALDVIVDGGDDKDYQELASEFQTKSYCVKSIKKNGSYFGRFKSLDEAQEAANKAVLEEKYGADDWEPEEKASFGDPVGPYKPKVGQTVYIRGFSRPFIVTGISQGTAEGLVTIETIIQASRLTR